MTYSRTPRWLCEKTETYILNFRLSHSEIHPAASLGRIMSKIISFPKNPNLTVIVGFPGGSISKEFTCNAEDLSLIPGLGRFPVEGHGYPLQYSFLENSMDRGAWQTIVLEVAKSRTQLSN
jgi:hypothetical protein